MEVLGSGVLLQPTVVHEFPQQGNHHPLLIVREEDSRRMNDKDLRIEDESARELNELAIRLRQRAYHLTRIRRQILCQ